MHTRNTLTIIAISALGICLFLSLAKMSKMSNKNKETCDKICGVLIFVSLSLIGAVQLSYITSKSNFEMEEESKSNSGKGYELIVLSASSWCGFCKKMKEQKQEMEKALEKKGIVMIYISDEDDKKLFEKVSKEHKASGFPHSVLLKDGKECGTISGYMSSEKFAEKASSLKK